MKTAIASLAAIVALAGMAAPAAAQPQRSRYDQSHAYGHNQAAYNINQRQARLDARIEQSVRRGFLSRSEARRLRSDSHEIARIEARYRRDGLSNRERADLDRRFDRLEAQIRLERADRDRGHRR